MLEKLGFAPSLCRLFLSYYDGHSTKYLWNVFFSKDYNTDNGVPQGDPLSPIIAVLYLSLIIKQLFPGTDGPTLCLSYIDDFVLLANNVLLRDNIVQLENAFSRLDDALATVGLRFEPNKMELMHFAPKDQSPRRGRKPIRFHLLFSSLPAIQLRSLQGRFPPVRIGPSKEWHYLGFYFDPFLSFSSHVSRYANKALIIAQNIRIMGHCYGGIDPKLRRQVYYAACWSVMTYGMPLWYRLHGHGVKFLLKKLNKTQNVALHWISGAFRTTPTFLLELFTGISPVVIRLDYQLRNFLARASVIPSSHPLRLLASWVPTFSPHSSQRQRHRPASENIHLLRLLFCDVKPFTLFSPLLRLGDQIVDVYSDRLSLALPKILGKVLHFSINGSLVGGRTRWRLVLLLCRS